MECDDVRECEKRTVGIDMETELIKRGVCVTDEPVLNHNVARFEWKEESVV